MRPTTDTNGQRRKSGSAKLIGSATGRQIRRFLWFCSGLLTVCGLLFGCQGTERYGPAPPYLNQPNQIRSIGPEGSGHPIDPNLIDALLHRTKQQADGGAPPTKKRAILALSGGGINGAFTAGVLKGWSVRGTRPKFDVVTGISTGGLISTFAFLGPQYDDLIGSIYTHITDDQVYQTRGPLALLTSDAQASSSPLWALINQHITPQLLQQVAYEHRQGRRLYIGTTNLDTRRLVIWDMGAIAASNRPDALLLYRQIVLASSSIPGLLPPVEIGVTVNGMPFTEMHADGGTTTQVFVRGTTLGIDAQDFRQGKSPLKGSDIYIIVSGKLYSPGSSTPRRGLDIGKVALESLTYAQARNDMIRIFVVALMLDMNYHVIAVPQEHQSDTDSLSFDLQEMRRLYQLGYQQGYSGQGWRDRPPGYFGSEQSRPRGGVHFQYP